MTCNFYISKRKAAVFWVIRRSIAQVTYFSAMRFVKTGRPALESRVHVAAATTDELIRFWNLRS